MVDDYYKEYLSRVKDAVESSSALGRISYWLEKHTRLSGGRYSFKGHEFQRKIIDSEHPNQVVLKPSQTGVSEMTARLCLGFIAVSPDTVSIYTLPTVNEALRFSKSRVDPIIKGSKYLNSIMVSGSDSSSFKQVGSSQLFMAGTFGKALISIPTDLLINDELDFSNPEVIATAESRLSHSRFYNEELDLRGIRRKFSTPTVPNVGVSDLFNKSNKNYRLVKCKHCSHWFHPDFLAHVRVTGYDRTMDEISYSQVNDLETRGLLNTAKLLCEKCHKVITKDNLMPEYRDWVEESPTVKHIEGFCVSPFDLPDYHTPSSLLRKRLEYKEEEGHFRNFTLGVPYSDSSNSISPTAVENNTTLPPVFPDSANVSGCVAGLDVGKTSWLVIAKPELVKEESYLNIIWAEQIDIRDNNEDGLFKVVVTRFKQFNVVKAVCDSLPYTDTILRICKQFSEGSVLPCLYTLSDRNLPMYVVNEKDQSVNANRTKTINLVVKQINTGKIKFARFPEINTIKLHLQGMKRIDKLKDNGSYSSSWVKTGQDHYFHALNYVTIASRLIEKFYQSSFSPGFNITQAVVGKQAEVKQDVDPLHLFKKEI